MLTVHHSNRLETLADALAEITGQPLSSAICPETIVVQSQGVARWLALRLADRAGVCANVRFLYPTAFSWELYRAAFRNLPEQSAFDPDVLAWRILGVLPGLEETASFAEVAAYVNGDALRRYELAAKLARLYDEYLAYRPDWIADWEREPPALWQGQLWRRLAQERASPHRAALQAQLQKRFAAGKPPIAMPERVCVFGMPALPPALLELFTALGRVSAVHLLVPNPCREYWGDIRSDADLAHSTLAGRAEAPYLDTGNRLLASLGKQGRDFIDLLGAIESDTVREIQCFVEVPCETLLGAIQSDVLDLRERAGDAPRTKIAAADRSVRFHCCHSAMREVEVLHDQLLDLFEAHRGLEPADVVVMTPDIEGYAPYIEAVFGTANPRIPFNVSDRTAEAESTLASTFMALLGLSGSRFEANRVLSILEEPAVQRRFGLTEGDVETARRWVREAQIRWGIDAGHRARLGLPPTHEHTWRFGLERLLLGYALPAGNERLFAGVLPYDEIEGSLGRVLGRFQTFAEAAMALDAALSGEKTVAGWCELLHGILVGFFDPSPERAEELEAVRSAVATIENEAQSADYAGSIPLLVALTVLRARLEVPGRAFLSGGVTFCAMMPMRSLPFEVVCMIGMNDAAFPRVRRRDGFDLMADAPRKGDRARRDDDRYLFLESILSARRCLYVSYTGRHIRDDSVIPPSVLVSELLDYIAHGYAMETGEDIKAALVTVHPLQAFSSRYFTGGDRLFSYSESFARAATTARSMAAAPLPLMTRELPPSAEAPAEVELDTLLRFFRHPARYFLIERLGIRLLEAEEEIEPHEPFTLDALGSYGLKQQLLESRLNRSDIDARALAHAGGVLPHGHIGDAIFEREHEAAEAFARKLEAGLAPGTLEPVTLGTDCGSLRLQGTLRGLTPAGLLLYRFAKVNAHDRVNAWIRHLALNAIAPDGVALHTRFIGQDCTLELSPVEDATDRLRELVQLYCEGLRRPVRFFPKTACEYSKKWELTERTQALWTGGDFKPGERDEDAYYALAFRGPDLLDAEFERTARIVFGPMRAVLSESKSA